eukprot:scaffold265946_cov18-Tisochrysis_lutea.AAC.1
MENIIKEANMFVTYFRITCVPYHFLIIRKSNAFEGCGMTAGQPKAIILGSAGLPQDFEEHFHETIEQYE